MAAYDALDAHGAATPRALPKVPGMNAEPMTRSASIGHTPNRISPTAKVRTSGCHSARPTSGRHLPKVNPGPKRRKAARPVATDFSARTLHAMWAKGNI